MNVRHEIHAHEVKGASIQMAGTDV
jgi:hypothetical protein